MDNNFYCSTNVNTESLFFSFFFSIAKQRKTNNELEEMKGIFCRHPVIIVFIFAVAVGLIVFLRIAFNEMYSVNAH